jgi:hypothetical protein
MSKLYSLHRLPELLADAKRERLFGKITFEFMDGEVKLVRKELTYKISHSEEENSNVQSSHSR